MVAAWFRTCKMLKDMRKRKELSEGNFDALKKKLALNRWRNRKDATKKMRYRAKQLKEQLDKKRARFYLTQWQ